MFVYNKAAREDFHCENLSSMFCVTSTLFQHSRLKLKSKRLCGGQMSPHFYFGRCCILQPVYRNRAFGEYFSRTLKRWFQFNSRIVRTHFASIMSLNNWKIDCRNAKLHFQMKLSLSSTYSLCLSPLLRPFKSTARCPLNERVLFLFVVCDWIELLQTL